MEAVKVTAGSVFSEIIDKVSFINYSSLLSRATAEDDDPTPGYMFDEITNITFQPAPNSQQLTEYLTRRLDRPSPRVKLKVLKILLYLVAHGSIVFRETLRRNDASVKVATMYHGVTDALLGTSEYELIRDSSQELLSALYAPALVQEDEATEPGVSETQRAKVHMGGLGAGGGQGKYQGFGSTPLDKEETVTEKVLDILDSIMNPVDETANTIKSAFSSSPGEYVAISVPAPSRPPGVVGAEGVRPHVVGRAGGGWESEEEEEEGGNNLSVDSLDKMESSVTEDRSQAYQLAASFSRVEEWPVSLTLLRDTMQRCAAMDCEGVVMWIAEYLQLPSASDVTRCRALLLIESFLRSELLPLSCLARLLEPALSHDMSHDTSHDMSHDLPLDPLVRSKVKAHKIRLIIRRLTELNTS